MSSVNLSRKQLLTFKNVVSKEQKIYNQTFNISVVPRFSPRRRVARSIEANESQCAQMSRVLLPL